MGLGDQSRLRQRTQSLCLIFSNFRGSLIGLNSSKEQQLEHDAQSVLDQHNTNRSLSLPSSLFFRMLTSHKEEKEEPTPDSDKSKDKNVGTSTECERDVNVQEKEEQNTVEITMVADRSKEKEEEGRVSDFEDGFMYARSPSFNVYLSESIPVCKDESKDDDKDKGNGCHNSNEMQKETEQSGRRFMKARSRAIRRNLLLLQHAIRSMRARLTLRKSQ